MGPMNSRFFVRSLKAWLHSFRKTQERPSQNPWKHYEREMKLWEHLLRSLHSCRHVRNGTSSKGLYVYTLDSDGNPVHRQAELRISSTFFQHGCYNCCHRGSYQWAGKVSHHDREIRVWYSDTHHFVPWPSTEPDTVHRFRRRNHWLSIQLGHLYNIALFTIVTAIENTLAKVRPASLSFKKSRSCIPTLLLLCRLPICSSSVAEFPEIEEWIPPCACLRESDAKRTDPLSVNFANTKRPETTALSRRERTNLGQAFSHAFSSVHGLYWKRLSCFITESVDGNLFDWCEDRHPEHEWFEMLHAVVSLVQRFQHFFEGIHCDCQPQTLAYKYVSVGASRREFHVWFQDLSFASIAIRFDEAPREKVRLFPNVHGSPYESLASSFPLEDPNYSHDLRLFFCALYDQCIREGNAPPNVTTFVTNLLSKPRIHQERLIDRLSGSSRWHVAYSWLHFFHPCFLPRQVNDELLQLYRAR